MSDKTLHVAVITPEGAAFEGDARKVVVPAFDGEVAFLPSHAPFVGQLGSGELRVTPLEGETQHFFLHGGVVQVADDRITILAEDVKELSALDVAAEADRLREILTTPAIGSGEVLEERQLAADAARARARVARKHADA
jgi:F-type H+-transporting ATPase subunit epsilon